MKIEGMEKERTKVLLKIDTIEARKNSVFADAMRKLNNEELAILADALNKIERERK